MPLCLLDAPRRPSETRSGFAGRWEPLPPTRVVSSPERFASRLDDDDGLGLMGRPLPPSDQSPDLPATSPPADLRDEEEDLDDLWEEADRDERCEEADLED